jgi:hypothetical protein
LIIEPGPHRKTCATSGLNRLAGRALDLVGRDAALEQRRAALLVAREHVEQRESAEMAVLQVLQLLAEHDAVGAAVAVDERQAGGRLRGERVLDHGRGSA